MSTNMTGGADGGIAIQVKLDTSKASKELTRLEQKILKLQEEVTVGKAKKSALVAQLEQANAELTAFARAALSRYCCTQGASPCPACR